MTHFRMNQPTLKTYAIGFALTVPRKGLWKSRPHIRSLLSSTESLPVRSKVGVIEVWVRHQAQLLGCQSTSTFFFVRYADDTDPRALYTESLFHEDPHRKVVVEQSGWPILLSADAEDRGSVQALMRARKWIWQCLKTHPRCSREAARLPKRVIDIGSTPDSPIRLHIPDPEDRIVTPYIALSYSWGTDLPLRTAKENLEKHCEEVPFEDFPRTLQDALHVTRGLGLRYIWIDALCIVQDDEPDWEEQAALMGEIYQGSVLNISATSSPSLSSGFLQRSGSVPSSRVRIGRYFHRDGVNHGGIYIGVFDLGGAFTPPSDLNESFLSSRGWVFQEQLMSTATLHYMDQEMVWECATTIRNERFADANAVITDPRLDGWTRLAPLKWGWINYLRSNKPDYFDRNRDGVLVPSAKNDEVFNVLMALWKEWIFDYSKRDLTYGKDRLPAIAGITQLISKKYRLHFTVGHFTQDMPLGLCWSPRRSRKVSLGGYQPNEAIKLPSWSWPSFPGGVWYSGSNKVHNLQITCSQSPSDLRILCYSFRTDGSSDVYAGTCLCIEVEGLLQDVQVEFTASSYYISTGVKVAHLRAYFDYPPPAEESPWQKYLLRVTGYNHKLYDLLVPFASEREKNVPGHEREPEVVSKLRQNPDNIWCLLLEEVLPSSESLRTFRRVGMADTDDRRSERGADVFVSPERLKMRLV
ncbi:HET-domain-containing protein [Cadophora sp. DSE1049]|nr:HET-domain-containing protein [Cadophora sp. DSE1049]